MIIFGSAICYFAFYKSKMASIEGNWIAKEITLNGKCSYKIDSNAPYLPEPTITANNWTDSIFFPHGDRKIGAKFQIIKNSTKIVMSSRNQDLNGTFNLHVDTLFLNPKEYKIVVQIDAKGTLINFYREVVIKPLKPYAIQRGRP